MVGEEFSTTREFVRWQARRQATQLQVLRQDVLAGLGTKPSSVVVVTETTL